MTEVDTAAIKSNKEALRKTAERGTDGGNLG